MTEEEDGDGEKHIAYKDYRGLIREFPQIAKWALEGNDDPIPTKKIPGLDASIITSGQFPPTRLPSAFIDSVQEMKDQVGSIIIILGQIEKRIAQLEERK